MKKLNWKLLLVLALALILVLAFVACNNKTNSNNPTPPSPSNQNLVGDQATQALLNELLAVSKNIGNQPVSDNDAFVNLDFSLNLGSRPDPTSAPLSLFSLGFKIQGVLDRTNNNNSNSTALNIAVSASDQDNNSVDVFNAFFQASDNSLYLTLGNQKVKMNVSLAQDLFSSLFSNLASSKGLSDFLALTGENFSLQSVVDFFVGDKTIDPHGMIGVILDAVGALSPEGKIDIEGIVSSETIYKLLKSTKTGNHYNATLADDMAPMVSGFLNADTAKGDDVLVNISFDSDNNHHLQNGLSISLDTVVGEANPFYNQVALKYGNTPSFPFVQLTLNSLNIAPASTSNSPSLPNGDYKDNLQFVIDENIHLQGFQLTGGLTKYWPTDIRLYASAKLDLVNELVENNETELYAYLQVKHLSASNNQEYILGEGMPIELTYKKGTLTLRTDAVASILEVAGGALNVDYNMLLANPIGNMIDGLLTGENKELFDSLYWVTQPDEQGNGGVWNKGFQGLVVKNLSVKNVVGMLNVMLNKTDDSKPENATAAEEESSGSSYFNALLYATTLLNSDEFGKLSIITKDGLLGTVGKFASMFGIKGDWSNDGIINTVVNFIDPLLKGLTGGMAGGKEVLVFEGITPNNFTQVLTDVLQEYPDAIKLNFDITKGINWDLSILMHKDAEVSLRWTSKIAFDEYTPVMNAKDRVKAAQQELKTSIESGELFNKMEEANTAVTNAEKAYNESSLKKAYDTKLSDFETAKEKFGQNNRYAGIEALHTSSSFKITSSAHITSIMNYLAAKYDYEKNGKTEALQSVINTRLNSLIQLVFTYGSSLKDYNTDQNKAKQNLQTALDAIYDDYARDVAPKQALVDPAKAAAEATDEYKAIATATAKQQAMQKLLSNAKERLKVYDRYTADNTVESIETKKVELDLTTLKQKNDAYQEALKKISDYIDAEIAKAKDQTNVDDIKSQKEKFIADSSTGIVGYLKYVVGYPSYASYFKPEDKGGKAIAEALYNAGAAEDGVSKEDYVSAFIQKIGADSEWVTALVEPFKNAYTVTGNGSRVTNNYDAAVSELASVYIWCEIDLAA